MGLFFLPFKMTGISFSPFWIMVRLFCAMNTKMKQKCRLLGFDQVYGGYISTKHLLELGHRKVAYCTGGYKSSVAMGREAGFRKALAEYNTDFIEAFVFMEAFTIEDGRRVFREILELDDKPTAIFSGEMK